MRVLCQRPLAHLLLLLVLRLLRARGPGWHPRAATRAVQGRLPKVCQRRGARRWGGSPHYRGAHGACCLLAGWCLPRLLQRGPLLLMRGMVAPLRRLPRRLALLRCVLAAQHQAPGGKQALRPCRRWPLPASPSGTARAAVGCVRQVDSGASVAAGGRQGGRSALCACAPVLRGARRGAAHAPRALAPIDPGSHLAPPGLQQLLLGRHSRGRRPLAPHRQLTTDGSA